MNGKKIGNSLNLPYHLVHKVPSDGLCGLTDEDNLGFSYDVLDQYIREGLIDNEEIKEKIDKRIKDSEFKRNPTATFVM